MLSMSGVGVITAARTKINQWVAQKTKEKIKDILPPGSLDALTRLVLANAIYFKGAWAKPYDKAQTSPQPFHLSAASQVTVPLMHHLDSGMTERRLRDYALGVLNLLLG